MLGRRGTATALLPWRRAASLSISESGSQFQPYPSPVMAEARMDAAQTRIEPGEQTLSVSLSVSFELE